MKAWLRKLARAAFQPAALGGAAIGLTLFQLGEGSHRLAGLIVGWLYGLVLAGLMRLVPVSTGWYWLAGAIAGPIPIALLMPGETPPGERGLIWVGALVGAVLGLLETAHARRSRTAGAPGVLAPLSPPDAGPPR